ncbi:MAG: cobalt-precorrin 5A hydrolase [Spirochaetota bacterium]
MIAGLISDKTTDPGVLVMDEKGNFVISLLSGHIGGANRGAQQIADICGAVPVITTSSDVNGMVSPDMLAASYGAAIDDMDRCRDITVRMVNGGKIALSADADIALPPPYVMPSDACDGIVYLTHRTVKKDDSEKIPSLHLVPKTIVIGAGCRKGTEPCALTDFIAQELDILGIDRRAVCCIASIDIKKDEPAIVYAAEFFNAQTAFYSAEQISAIEHGFACSDFVRAATGAGCVAEPCAWLASQENGKMLVTKKKKDGMTLSIAQRELKETVQDNYG